MKKIILSYFIILICFVVLSAEELSVPEIQEVTPPEAKIAERVIIKGKYFSPIKTRNTVWFGNVPAEIIEATSESIIVTVPKEAKSGTLSIEVSGQRSKEVRFMILPYLEFVLAKKNISPGKETKGIIIVHGSSNPWKIRVMNKYYEVIDLKGGNDQVLVSSGGLDNKIELDIIAKKRGNFSLMCKKLEEIEESGEDSIKIGKTTKSEAKTGLHAHSKPMENSSQNKVKNQSSDKKRKSESGKITLPKIPSLDDEEESPGKDELQKQNINSSGNKEISSVNTDKQSENNNDIKTIPIKKTPEITNESSAKTNTSLNEKKEVVKQKSRKEPIDKIYEPVSSVNKSNTANKKEKIDVVAIPKLVPEKALSVSTNESAKKAVNEDPVKTEPVKPEPLKTNDDGKNDPISSNKGEKIASDNNEQSSGMKMDTVNKSEAAKKSTDDSSKTELKPVEKANKKDESTKTGKANPAKTASNKQQVNKTAVLERCNKIKDRVNFLRTELKKVQKDIEVKKEDLGRRKGLEEAKNQGEIRKINERGKKVVKKLIDIEEELDELKKDHKTNEKKIEELKKEREKLHGEQGNIRVWKKKTANDFSGKVRSLSKEVFNLTRKRDFIQREMKKLQDEYDTKIKSLIT